MKYLNIILFLFSMQLASAQTAKEIIQKSDEKSRGAKSAITEMKITIVRPKWTREMELKTWTKGEDHSLTLIQGPAKDKGTTFLKRDKEIWNYIPSIERSIKLPPSMMMQSWMGTDLTNDDLVKESSVLNDYEQTVVGDSTIQNRLCYKIELIPKENAPVVWGKVILFIDKKDFIQLRSEMYDEDDYLVNVMNSSGIKLMGGKMLATKLEVIPVEEEGQKTLMEIESIEFDTPIEDSFFTVKNMKKLR